LGEDLDAWADWERIRLAHSGYSALRPVRPGQPHYACDVLQETDIVRLIQTHLGGTPIEESCAFFGGLLLACDAATLFPQCCATLSEAHLWACARQSGTHAIWSGHPGPVLHVQGGVVRVECEEDATGGFVPPVPASFSVGHVELCAALDRAMSRLSVFGARVDAAGRTLGLVSASASLVFSEE
jgi:hypothetical protein